MRYGLVSFLVGTAFIVYVRQALQLKRLKAEVDGGSEPSFEFTFVGFPHHAEVTSADCDWKVPSDSEKAERHLRLLSTSKRIRDPDLVQTRVLREGICEQAGGHHRQVHIFSSKEALSCLRGRTVYFTGDSYVQNLFVGLGEVLLPDLASNEEFYNGTQRFEATELVNTTLREVNERSKGSFPRIQLICRQECRGSETDFVTACPECLRQQYPDRDALIFGSAIHLFLNSNHSASFTLESLDSVLPEIPDASYNFPPKIPHMELVPSHRQPLMIDFLPFHSQLMQLLTDHHVPVLDWSALTSKCTMANCSVDGHHKTRYVNRWKAQLLLNTLCKAEHAL